jgi:hypothetical protein
MQRWQTLFDIRCNGPELMPMTTPSSLHFAMLALGAPLSAQTYTWDSEVGTANGARAWGHATNWVDNPSPLTFTNTTDIIFAQASITNNGTFSLLGSNRTIRSLTFEANFLGAPGTGYGIRLHTNGTGTLGSANLTFAADSGNASITAIPEPSTYLTAAGLLAILLAARKRSPRVPCAESCSNS